jgi:ankyrin repeat protein
MTFQRNGGDLNSGDYDQRTALHLAASNNNLPAVDWLLRNGGPGIDVNVVDRIGLTPLDDAVRHGHDVVQLLLEKNGALRGRGRELDPGAPASGRLTRGTGGTPTASQLSA